jgi:hypothetical protein
MEVEAEDGEADAKGPAAVVAIPRFMMSAPRFSCQGATRG